MALDSGFRAAGQNLQVHRRLSWRKDSGFRAAGQNLLGLSWHLSRRSSPAGILANPEMSGKLETGAVSS
jgi:hypothetical protein